MNVTKSRSLVKAFTYRVWGTISSFLIALVFTGSAELSGLIALWETIIKVGIYYIHERGWNLISWGRKNGIN